METGKQLVQRYIRSYETGDLDNVKAFLHPSHVYHPPGGGKPMDLKERLSDEAFFFRAFSDIKTAVEDQVAEGDKVASRIAMHCTHTGDYQGLQPTDKRITITYLDIVLLKDGRILQEWAEFDMLNLLNQLR